MISKLVLSLEEASQLNDTFFLDARAGLTYVPL